MKPLGLPGFRERINTRGAISRDLRKVNNPDAGKEHTNNLHPEAVTLARRREYNVRWWWRYCLNRRWCRGTRATVRPGISRVGLKGRSLVESSLNWTFPGRKTICKAICGVHGFKRRRCSGILWP